MSKTALEVLTEARPFIAEHWTRGTLRDLVTGNVCAVGAVLAGRYSLEEVSTNSGRGIYGNLKTYRDLDDGNGAREAIIALFNALPDDFRAEYYDAEMDFMGQYDTIIAYNDHELTTQADVLALFDRAIESLKGNA